MSSNKTGTPITSPQKQVKLDVPSTPPASKGKKHLLAFLATPEQPDDNLPFSPALKRSNSGTFKSPDYKFNTENLQSPYSSNALLKTPRNSGYDSDDRDTPRRSKVLRTPQFFSPGRRLFADDQGQNKQELQEISTQLKSKLSLALGKLKGQEKTTAAPVQLNFAELSFTSTQESPTKKHRQTHESMLPSSSLQRTNLNLQTLQLTPAFSHPESPPSTGEGRLYQPPKLTETTGGRISIPSPDEESSAHNALLAAFSRLRRKSGSRSSMSEDRRQSIIQALNELPRRQKLHEAPPMKQTALPPLNVALDNNQNGDSEQDAVYSLMSLSSPQSVKQMSGNHSRLHSQNNNSPTSSTSSLALPVLPPISGLISKIDHDETDVENATTEEESD